MKSKIFAAAACLLLAATAHGAELKSIKRAYMKLGIGTAPDAGVGRLRGDAKREYRDLHKSDMGEGTLVIGLPNPSGKKNTIAGSTFAIFMSAGVGTHLRIFRRSDQKLIASGDAIDGPMRWTKLK
jgi:hypothetical protein